MMCVTDRPFALFETPIGTCALAWSPRGITAVQLPERDARETRARMLRRFPPAREAPPPPEARLAIDAICGLLHGAAVDLSFITLDMVSTLRVVTTTLTSKPSHLRLMRRPFWRETCCG